MNCMKKGQKIFKQRSCDKFRSYIRDIDMQSSQMVFLTFNAF